MVTLFGIAGILAGIWCLIAAGEQDKHKAPPPTITIHAPPPPARTSGFVLIGGAALVAGGVALVGPTELAIRTMAGATDIYEAWRYPKTWCLVDRADREIFACTAMYRECREQEDNRTECIEHASPSWRATCAWVEHRYGRPGRVCWDDKSACRSLSSSERRSCRDQVVYRTEFRAAY